MDVNHPREAIEVLESVPLESEWAPRWPGGLGIYGDASHQLGDSERELLALRRLGELRPHDHFVAWAVASHQFSMNPTPAGLADLVDEQLPTSPNGRWNRATALAGIAGELRAHGHYEMAELTFDRAFAIFDSFPSITENSRLIYGMLLHEGKRWAAAREVFASLEPSTSFGPVDIDREGYLALISARLGEVEEARAGAARIAALPPQMEAAGGRSAYYAAMSYHFRARIAAALGDREEAVRILRASLASGKGQTWRDVMFDVHVSVDYLVLKGYPLFEELIRPKG